MANLLLNLSQTHRASCKLARCEMACISRCVLKVRKMRLISYPPNNQKFTKKHCNSRTVPDVRELHGIFQAPMNQTITKGYAFLSTSETLEKCVSFYIYLIIRCLQKGLHFSVLQAVYRHNTDIVTAAVCILTGACEHHEKRRRTHSAGIYFACKFKQISGS